MGWFELYLLTLIPEVRDTAGVVAGLSFVVSGLLCVPFAMGMDKGPYPTLGTVEAANAVQAGVKKLWRYLLPTFAVCAVLSTILPSQKSLMFIVGGSTLIEATKTDAAQRLADKSVKAVEAWLDEQAAPNK